MKLNLVWHRMLYSCTHTVRVGIPATYVHVPQSVTVYHVHAHLDEGVRRDKQSVTIAYRVRQKSNP